MSSHLSQLLHLFIDAYARDAERLENEIASIEPINLDAVTLEDQASLLTEADRVASDEIFRKTLIDTATKHEVHKYLKETLGNSSEKTDPISLRAKLQASKAHKANELERAEEMGLSESEYEAYKQVKALARKDIASQMLRFFADHLDELSDVIEKLDETKFNKLIPEHLIVPFRECHINFALGNYGTALILCGALLERSLQDLLPSDKLLNVLIQEAKAPEVGLLNGHYRRSADRIRDDRNDTVHGNIRFDEITSHRAWETIMHTRLLIAELYKDRLI